MSQVFLNMEKSIKYFTGKGANERSEKKNHLIKSSWNLGNTVTMRIPLALKKRLQKIARHLDNDGEIELLDHEKTDRIIQNSETILSQEYIEKAIVILKHGIASKKQGGIYSSNNASSLKAEVIKALAILEELVSDA